MSAKLVVDNSNRITGIQGNRLSATKSGYPVDCKDHFVYLSSLICTCIYCMVPYYRSALSFCQFYPR